MATVYLARDLKHDRPLALKVLHPELAGTQLHGTQHSSGLGEGIHGLLPLEQ